MNIRAKIFGSSKPEQPVLRDEPAAGAKAIKESSAVATEEVRRGNNRSADRHRLSSETVRFSHNGNTGEAELINLSGGGAMLQGKFDMKLWDRVDLHLGDHGTIECAVRWIRDERIGLEFAHETRLDCSADELASVLREIIARSFAGAHFAPATEAAPPEPAHENTLDSEHRGQPRHPLIWSGVLHCRGQSTTTRVRNISDSGAMIEASATVDVGSEALLELNEAASMSATVQWVVGDQIGLRFHDRFDMQLLGRSKPQVASAKWVRPAYLDKVCVDDESAWDSRWNRLSLQEIKELEGFLKR